MKKMLGELGTFIKNQETISGKVYECIDEAIAYIENQMRYTLPNDSDKIKYLNFIKEHLFDTKIDFNSDKVYHYLGTWGVGNYILDDTNGQPLLFNAIDCMIKKYDSSNDDSHTNDQFNPQTYTQELLDLFNGHEELINELTGLSNHEIAQRIKEWARGSGNGKPLIKNPKNNLRLQFAEKLKENGIITESISNFRNRF